MIATLRVAAKKSKLLADWEETYKNICMNPPVEVSRIIDDLLRPLEEIAAQGADEKDFPEILKHVQKLESLFRSYGR